MLEARENKLFFGAKAKFFVFIANLNSTSRIISGIAPTCQSLEIAQRLTNFPAAINNPMVIRDAVLEMLKIFTTF